MIKTQRDPVQKQCPQSKVETKIFVFAFLRNLRKIICAITALKMTRIFAEILANIVEILAYFRENMPKTGAISWSSKKFAVLAKDFTKTEKS